MNWQTIDWKALDRLRGAFLSGTAGAEDYWRKESDLESYDATFAQRIGWKWDYVFRELQRRGWTPPVGEVLDWGCGTGIASRRWLEFFGAATMQRLFLCDRSPLAMQFAARRVRAAFPALNVWLESMPPPQCDVMLISHVMTELSVTQCNELVRLAARATAVVWVEPGTFAVSRRLLAVREQLRHAFQLVAPCPHRESCGLLTPENDRHWCHHFVPSPPEAFTDGNWARFAQLAGVDLRSLPLTYLVLDRRVPAALPAGTVRVLGEPRVYKPHALVLACDVGGVQERRVTKRRLPEEFRAFKKGKFDSLPAWECAGDEVVAVQRKIP